MAVKNFLAFDMGAESGRAMVGALDGGRLTLHEKYRFANPNGKIAGHFHWDLIKQWEELKTGLRKAAADTKLSGIGIDTWGVDFGLLAPNGEILGNPYMYRGTFTQGVMERTFKRVSRERIFNVTGLQLMEINTIFQLIALREMKSPMLDVAESLLFVPDLFNYLFTGVKANEFSIASTSQLYDPTRKAWATDLMGELDIPAKLFQKIVPSGTVLGNLTDAVAAECGAGPIPLIAPACHDTGSAVAAVPASVSGAEKPDWCYISSGTWSLMGVELNRPVINEKSLKYNYTNEGGVGGSIRFLKNIVGMLLVQECRKQWASEGYEHSYAELASMAEAATPFLALIDPNHLPFLAPGNMPAKIEAFCRKTGQKEPHSRAEFVRTCLESLALAYRRTIEGFEDILGQRINVIHIVGGGCQNTLLNQMTADACGRTVIAGPVEATAAGNILTQAIATGDVKDLAALRTIVRNSFDVKHFEPRNSSASESAYARFQGVVGS